MTEDHDLVDRLVQTAFIVTAQLTRLAADTDLSLTQLRVLGILRDRRLGVTELAGYLGLEKSTMSGLVARAEARGLLRREASDVDRRAIEVVITAQGTSLIEGLYLRVQQALQPMTSRLTGAEQRRTAALLAQLMIDPD